MRYPVPLVSECDAPSLCEISTINLILGITELQGENYLKSKLLNRVTAIPCCVYPLADSYLACCYRNHYPAFCGCSRTYNNHITDIKIRFACYQIGRASCRE